MAILYGTTADGDSLPVEVNEFGQLVAQGLQGQEGPPGPPGLPELPPDPFEGAILGWQDNALAWLGGVVPVPPGTFGPIISYENGVLELETVPDYVYGQEVFMSNEAGDVASYSDTTSLIKNAGQLEDTFESKYVQNDQGSQGIANGTSYAARTRFFTDELFAVYDNDSATVSLVDLLKVQNELHSCWYSLTENGVTTSTGDVTSDKKRSIATWKTYFPPGTYGIATVKANTGVGNGSVSKTSNLPTTPYLRLTFPDSSGFEYFTPGMIVQEPDVAILFVNSTDSVIRTTGGSWFGSDGSGDPGAEIRVSTPPKSGSGSVQSVIANSVVLRADNGEWRAGNYISSKQQLIAARYVYADEVKRNLL